MNLNFFFSVLLFCERTWAQEDPQKNTEQDTEQDSESIQESPSVLKTATPDVPAPKQKAETSEEKALFLFKINHYIFVD